MGYMEIITDFIFHCNYNNKLNYISDTIINLLNTKKQSLWTIVLSNY